jgi:hypothetical protein
MKNNFVKLSALCGKNNIQPSSEKNIKKKNSSVHFVEK